MAHRHLSKIDVLMKERIREKVEIYGGSTSSCQEIGEIWYPSHGIFRQNAIELRAWLFGFSQRSRAPFSFFDKMTPEERIRVAGAQISYYSSWREGALASAEYALHDLDNRIGAAIAA